jgi:hypothetical protein
VHQARGARPPPAPCMSAWALACHMSSLTARTFKCCVGVFGHVSCWCMCTHMLGHLSRPHGVSLASVRAFVGAWAVRVAFVRVGDLRRLGVCACVCLRDAFVSAFARVAEGALARVSVRLCVGAIVRAWGRICCQNRKVIFRRLEGSNGHNGQGRGRGRARWIGQAAVHIGRQREGRTSQPLASKNQNTETAGRSWPGGTGLWRGERPDRTRPHERAHRMRSRIEHTGGIVVACDSRAYLKAWSNRPSWKISLHTQKKTQAAKISPSPQAN